MRYDTRILPLNGVLSRSEALTRPDSGILASGASGAQNTPKSRQDAPQRVLIGWPCADGGNRMASKLSTY